METGSLAALMQCLLLTMGVLANNEDNTLGTIGHL